MKHSVRLKGAFGAAVLARLRAAVESESRYHRTVDFLHQHIPPAEAAALVGTLDEPPGPFLEVVYTHPDDRFRAFEEASRWAAAAGETVPVRQGSRLVGHVRPGQKHEAS